MPCHNTYRRVLGEAINVEDLQHLTSRYLTDGLHQRSKNFGFPSMYRGRLPGFYIVKHGPMKIIKTLKNVLATRHFFKIGTKPD